MAKECSAEIQMLKIVNELAGYAVRGVRNKDLADRLSLKPPMVTRKLQMLIDFGWARKEEVGDLYFPTASLGEVFGRVLNDINRAKAHIGNIEHNFTKNIGS